MKAGRIVKISKQTTLVLSNNNLITFPFKSKHSLNDIIDENDNLLVKSYKSIDFKNALEKTNKKYLLIDKTKQFFKQQGFLEALTPKLKKLYLNERHIKKIKTRYGYLVPSFEIEHKKLLCLGFEKVFELNFAYRDDFEDKFHSKEFLMLEWYRAYAKPEDIFEDFKKLCKFLNDSKDILELDSKHINLDRFEFFSYEELFLKYLGLDILHFFDKKKIISKYNLEANLTKSQVLDYLFATHIEKHLGNNCINIVYNFPDFTFLAKKEGKYAKRYEFYINGIEIANCYDEENDFLRLEKYFNKQTDPEFVDYMAFGMPKASGIALGFDRLLKLIM
ncbi:lysyl-tRNA synthetase, class 2 [Desulfurella multipotens]|uniref:Lysyl-tRNA synthetase, class 2 n=1 Tax=Desulfurella multipotens TaxID=79269 RepID=A0A1G6NDT5_9BACT|nr:amino acid--tRNA ligase-related protein [Desulfurella multipotens]SDC65990.1 lysyl-tRNA synthetase, class 2 [Desulfurella multipotens]